MSKHKLKILECMRAALYYISFHELALTQGSSHIELPKYTALKKAVIIPKNNDEQSIKWVVIAAYHTDEIAKDPQHISKLACYEDQ